MRRLFAVLAGMVAFGAAHSAEPRRDVPGTAIARAAREVAAQAVAAGVESPVAVVISAPTPELMRGFSAALAPELTRLGHAALFVDAPPAEAEAAARASGGRALLRIALSVDRGLLTARGDVFRIRANFWSGSSGVRTGAGAAVATSTEVDAHALALAAPLLDTGDTAKTPMRLMPTALMQLPVPTAALAAGDLDGDGRDELIVLTDSELTLLTAAGAVITRRSLRELPSSATPCREPYGAIAIAPGTPARFGYFSARRGRGEWAELAGRELRVVGPLERPVLAAGGQRVEGAWIPGQNSIRVDGAVEPVVHASPFLGPTGPQLLAVHADGSGTWSWLDGTRTPVTLGALGAGTTLVDLDADGTPEIATSSTEYAPRPDLLRVTDAAQTVLWEVPLERGRILQLVPADLDGDRRPELVAGVWLPDGTAELRVFKRVTP